ncbi:histidinol-phosphate transaminase [Marinimicrobium alkaliphilum]|uniref:histidinol-phosphate transaminase n=1 Tax=Marinimicrobium alkaliphilum TaxID=2202654 RepID=UPI000DB98FE4|nr:histidinol-phosphate transaminase [Marinimicrobium alkaliphilum]
MSRFWSPRVRQLVPYVPGEQPQIEQLIKLNTNENPYPPSPRVAQVLDDAALRERLRLYPDPESRRFSQAVADYYQIERDQVFVGNGSDEVLALAFMAFFQQDKPLLYPDITYSFYPVYCQLFGIEAETVALGEDFRLKLTDFDRPNGGIIFPNPNAPTSLGLPLAEIEALLTRNRDSVVIVDEAYVDYGAESAVALVQRFPNLLVVQTLSKSRSLAGLRLGYAIGHPALIEGLERVKNSFNSYPVDALAQAAGEAAMADTAYFEQCRDRVIATRERTRTALETLDFTVLPSQANFLFARPPAGQSAEALAQQLRDARILVRYFNKPRISEFLRISVGTDAEMDAFLAALGDCLGQ